MLQKGCPKVEHPESADSQFFVQGEKLAPYSACRLIAVCCCLQLVHYQAGKQPVLLGGIQPLPNGEFAPLLATRGGSVAEPLYYW